MTQAGPVHRAAGGMRWFQSLPCKPSDLHATAWNARNAASTDSIAYEHVLLMLEPNKD